jgi:dTDP-4-amino-4,6-dideoxygalactose transaminase
MAQLAVLGGRPVRTKPFPSYRPLGEQEAAAVAEVMRSGVLSKFLGTWHPDFYGGPEVRAFEEEWAQAVGASHAIAVNSATSGLYAAVGAAGVGPGDEVIVSPYTMSASAAGVLVYNAVPIFADIDPDTYCIDAKTIAQRLTPRTRAIIVVHIFGRVTDMDPIMDLARLRNLVVIEDCAQSPLATYKGRRAGSLGHMGVFSLNYHKHIHTGEGGLVTTRDPELAERVQLIRNHAEAVIDAKKVASPPNMIGFNYRMGELEAAIGRHQLRKAPELIKQRQDNVGYLEERLAGLPGLGLPKVSEPGSHVYYVHPIRYNPDTTGVARERVVRALRAELPETLGREGEGALLSQGYIKPLYLQPIYQSMVGYGRTQCPFRCPLYEGSPDYSLGSCPQAEDAHLRTLILHELMRPGMQREDLDAVAAAFQKVFSQLNQLATLNE